MDYVQALIAIKEFYINKPLTLKEKGFKLDNIKDWSMAELHLTLETELEQAYNSITTIPLESLESKLKEKLDVSDHIRVLIALRKLKEQNKPGPREADLKEINSQVNEWYLKGESEEIVLSIYYSICSIKPGKIIKKYWQMMGLKPPGNKIRVKASDYKPKEKNDLTDRNIRFSLNKLKGIIAQYQARPGGFSEVEIKAMINSGMDAIAEKLTEVFYDGQHIEARESIMSQFPLMKTVIELCEKEEQEINEEEFSSISDYIIYLRSKFLHTIKEKLEGLSHNFWRKFYNIDSSKLTTLKQEIERFRID